MTFWACSLTARCNASTSVPVSAGVGILTRRLQVGRFRFGLQEKHAFLSQYDQRYAVAFSSHLLHNRSRPNVEQIIEARTFDGWIFLADHN